MAYSPEFETEKAVYRLFLTDHFKATKEDILTPERLAGLDGIILEVTGDGRIHNPPETVFRLLTHSHVIEIAESLGNGSPPVYVVDVHMDNILSDVLPDMAAGIFGGALLALGLADLVVLSTKETTRRGFVGRLIKGIAKCSLGFPLGTYDKMAMIALGSLKGEFGEKHLLTWDYLDQFVPHMVTGRDAIYARLLEEGVVPLVYKTKLSAPGTSGTGGKPRKPRLDIHCGAGHKRMPQFIQNKETRDKILRKYAMDGYSTFDERYMHVFYEFKYDPTDRKWHKKEFDTDLFMDAPREDGIA
jgi:hypothetical protein